MTTTMLEDVRKRLRLLVRLIEKKKRKVIYTDFEDELGTEAEIDLLGVAPQDNFEQFRTKARAFLRAHEDHIAIHRLRTNKALTPTDLAELERMLVSSGIGDTAAIQKAKEDSQGLGLFVRSLVGLDRGAAKEAFANFLTGKTLNANQIHFIDMIINHLTKHGVMSAALLYESPFTDLSPHGPDGLFTSDEVNALVAVLDQVRAAAISARLRKSHTFTASSSLRQSTLLLGLTIVKTLHISWRFLTKISQRFSRVEKRAFCCLALTENILEQQEQIYDR